MPEVTYLDHAATTPVRPEAAEAMAPWLTSRFGNPSGGHALARAARQAVEEARDVVAAALGCAPREVVFTGGGTESDNLAVAGVVGSRGGTPVCSAVEHHAVLNAVTALGGYLAPVGVDGRVDLDGLDATLVEAGRAPGGVTLVSVMLANNEVGAVQPLADVTEVVRQRAPGAAVHTDAVQAVSWVDVAVAAAGADLVSISAHKLGGPQGVGALVVRDGVSLEPILRGGGQEAGRRSGTHNVAGIVGFAAALAATVEQRAATVERVALLRDRLADGLLAAVPGCRETGDRRTRIAGSCPLLLEGVESEALLVLLDRAGLCATAASSCASGAMEPSHVLSAMGVPRSLAYGSLRLSLGWCSSDAEVDRALAIVPEAVGALRARSTPAPARAPGAAGP